MSRSFTERIESRSCTTFFAATKVFEDNKQLLAINPERDALFELLERNKRAVKDRRLDLKSKGAKDATFGMTPGDAFILGLARAYETLTKEEVEGGNLDHVVVGNRR